MTALSVKIAEAEGAAQPAADACLNPLLRALDWVGEPRHLYEALPDGQTIADFDNLVAVLARLKYTTNKLRPDPSLIDEEAMPALFIDATGDVWVLIRQVEPGLVEVFKGRQARLETVEISELSGEIFMVRPEEPEPSNREQGRFGWISGLLERERGLVRLLFAVAFLINCLALSLPLYLLSVFDLAINSRSTVTLATLAGGIMVIIGAEIALREIRARAIAQFAVRTQIYVMTSVFKRLLRLPIAYVESASVAGQLNRLRSFESVRDIFSGPLAASLLDLPYIAVFVIAVFVIGGPLGWLVVSFIAILAFLATFFIPRARAQSFRAGTVRSETRLFRTEIERNLGTIRDSDAENIWAQRYRELIARQMNAGLSAQHIGFSEQTIAQALSAITGALVVGLGALQVVQGNLSVGALAAVMAIVWRVLSPIQTALLNLNRVFQALDTAKQINQLMRLPREAGGDLRKSYNHVRGDIDLENVAFRSSAHALPILRGIDLKIEAGQLIAVAGAPGSSRGTLLKIIANLYPPSAGRVRIDGSDARQFDVRELRHCIAFVNDEQTIFSGTLAQNLLLASPLASEEQMQEAAHDADLTKFIKHLSDGLYTELDDMLRAGLSSSICQKIRLARAYLLSPSIYVFDEPTKDLNPSGQMVFMNKLAALKGRNTVIAKTSDLRILNLADRIVYLEAGLLHAGRGPARPQTQLARPQNRQPLVPKGTVRA